MTEPATIAVIDDDAGIREATENLLRSYGFDALAFDSAEAFLASGAAEAADFIVTDLQMPGLDGIGLMDELSRRGASIPTIVITAFPEERLRRRCTAQGVVAFLGKPFEGDVLVRHIVGALGH